MPFRSLPLILVILAIALTGAIAACGGGDDDGNGEATVTETVAEPAPDDGEAAQDRDEGRSGGQASRGCRDIDRTGTINMAGAGTVELERSGNRLSVSNARPAEGWRSSVDRDDDVDEIKVEFRAAARRSRWRPRSMTAASRSRSAGVTERASGIGSPP